MGNGVFKLKSILAISVLTLLSACGSSSDDSGEADIDVDPVAAIDTSRGGYLCFDMTTSMGTIELALDRRNAPITTQNFREYAAVGFYDGTIFHRVIEDFMIQGGGFDETLEARETNPAIENESYNGLKNYRGRIAMARTSAPNSATSQFFINTVDNGFLNKAQASDGIGYAVFGGVIKGMNIVDSIEEVATGAVAGMQDVPVENVVIESVREMDCPN